MISVVAMISEHASPLPDQPSDWYGSQHIYVEQLARHLVRSGVSVDVFTRCTDPSQPEVVMSHDGYRVIHIKAGPMETIAKEELFPYMPIFARNIFSFMQQESCRYDLVHAHFWMSAWVAMQLRQQLEAPWVATFHGLGKIRRLYQGEHDRFPDERFKVEDQIAKHADLIIAKSQVEMEQLIDHYGADPHKIAVIPCGFERDEFYPVDQTATRRLLHLPENTPIILSVGRLARRKGFDNVIRGFACFRRRSQQRGLLIIAGGMNRAPSASQSAELEYLQSVARDEGVDHAVLFVGPCHRNELKFYYCAADVLVTTPWYEPFGLTAVEAMACGTPVIASAVDGLVHCVAMGESGWLIPPRQPEPLGQILHKVFTNPEERLRIGKQALRRARRLYDWNKVCSHIVRAYSSVTVSPIPLRQAG